MTYTPAIDEVMGDITANADGENIDAERLIAAMGSDICRQLAEIDSTLHNGLQNLGHP